MIKVFSVAFVIAILVFLPHPAGIAAYGQGNAGANQSMAYVVSGASNLGDKAYSPNPIQVALGDTVTWTNADTTLHTVTSGTTPTADNNFDSAYTLAPGKTFSHTFNAAGTFPYFCKLHPTMIGVVDVITIKVSTDKSAYRIGDTVTILGRVSPIVPGQSVVVEVFNPNGAAYRFDLTSVNSTGAFSYPFIVGGNLGIPGAYRVTVTYNSAQAQTHFTEFIANKNLVGWWKFDEGHGTTSADSSGNGNNGTLVNNPFWVNKLSCIQGKSCLGFDGSSQYVSVADSGVLKGMSSLTVSAWFKRSLVNNETQVIVTKGELIGANTSSYGIWIDSNNHVEFACDTGTCGDLISPASISDTTHWHFAVGTYRNHQERLYVDGALVATYAVPTGKIHSTTDPLTIGKRTHPTSPLFFGGSIDDVRVYDQVLGPTVISDMYTGHCAAAVGRC